MPEAFMSGALLFDHIAFSQAQDELNGASPSHVLIIHAQTIKQTLILLAALKRAVWYLQIEEPHNVQVLQDLEDVIRKAERIPHAQTSSNPTL